MKFTRETFACDGCGQEVANYSDMLACEALHKGKVKCKFVIGKGAYKGFINAFSVNESKILFSMDLWIPFSPDYKLPIYTDDGIHIMRFEFCGENESTYLKQKQIPIFRLKYIEKDNVGMNPRLIDSNNR